ncbi:hypothetical protein ABE10_01815, partial [Bacillus toyonensis]|nr:hypothetical protein [Bacillus toyonensis]
MADSLDVQPACGDIGGDEDVELAVLEVSDGALALHLRDVAVDRGGGVSSGPQLLGQGLGLVLGADEHDHPVEVLHFEDAGEGVHLLRVGDHEVPLGDVRVGGGPRLDRDLLGIVQILLGEPTDLRGHGRREQGDLLVVRRLRENLLDVFGEPHLQHLVGLVEHEMLEVGQVERALGEMVHDAPGGSDDDVHA